MRELIRWCRDSSRRLRSAVRAGETDAPSPLVAPQRDRRRVLVVCSSNVCRSPFVATALQRLLGDDEWQVVSAGTDAQEGKAVSDSVSAVAAEHGVDLYTHRSRRVTREMVCTADLIIAMSHEQVRALLEIEPGARRRIRLLGGFHPLPDAWGAASARTAGAGENGASKRSLDDVSCDSDCCRELMTGVAKLSRFILRREASRRPPNGRSPLSTPPWRTARAR